jgi:hypothetical protein
MCWRFPVGVGKPPVDVAEGQAAIWSLPQKIASTSGSAVISMCAHPDNPGQPLAGVVDVDYLDVALSP